MSSSDGCLDDLTAVTSLTSASSSAAERPVGRGGGMQASCSALNAYPPGQRRRGCLEVSAECPQAGGSRTPGCGWSGCRRRPGDSCCVEIDAAISRLAGPAGLHSGGHQRARAARRR